MSGRPVPAPPFEWVGGAPSLDFTNTVSWSAPVRTNERLRSYPDLLRWTREAGLTDPAEARALLRQAATHPRQASRVFRQGIELRAALHQIFTAHADEAEPEAPAVDGLNRVLTRALGGLGLGPGPGGWSWEWTARPELERPVWRTAWSAARLLTAPDLALLKRCADPQCGWVFLDRSRNHARRWCDMRVCGNNAKARRFYRRRMGRGPG